MWLSNDVKKNLRKGRYCWCWPVAKVGFDISILSQPSITNWSDLLRVGKVALILAMHGVLRTNSLMTTDHHQYHPYHHPFHHLQHYQRSTIIIDIPEPVLDKRSLLQIDKSNQCICVSTHQMFLKQIKAKQTIQNNAMNNTMNTTLNNTMNNIMNNTMKMNWEMCTIQKQCICISTHQMFLKQIKS